MASKYYRDITIGGEKTQVHMGDAYYNSGDELVDVLEWLSPTLDVAFRDIGIYCKCWRSESDAPSFLWCYGGPGTGKTFLTSLVLDELLSAVGNEDIGVAYIYLDYADRQAQTLDNIIASLAKQLSLWKKSNEDIKALYEQCQRGKSRPDLSKLASTLKTVCNRFKQVFFVLDALDECEDKIRRLLLAQLNGLEKSRCRYFLTCRPHLQDLQRNHPVFSYAAANWPYHAGSELSNESGQLALRFLEDKHKVVSATQAMMVGQRIGLLGYSQMFPNKFTGLHMASYYGLKESVESLLASNWEIDERDSYSRTPLSWAAENGYEAVVKLLLEKGAQKH